MTTMDSPTKATSTSISSDKGRKPWPSELYYEGYPESGHDGSPDFVWEEYLEETNTKAAPPTSFTHVEHSIVSCFSVGMKLEVPNSEDKDCFWVASVVMTCGPLLSLRYLGYGDDRSFDFWFDVKAGDFHPVGWCNKNGKKLFAPKGIRDKHADFQVLLTSELENDTIPAALLSDPESCITPIDQIKAEMVVEVQDEHNYQNVWPAKVIQNVGGRLLLRYEGSPSSGKCDFWLFYLSERIHPVGWAEEQELNCSPPKGKRIKLGEKECEKVLKSAAEQAARFPFPEHVLEPQLIIEDHEFEEGMKLEILNPLSLLDIRAATVTKVLDTRFFIVNVDNLKKEDERGVSFPSVCCHSLTSTIFPCGWAQENDLKVPCPEGYKSPNDDGVFNWGDYLSFHKAVPAPKEFFNPTRRKSDLEIGLKLEAVNPFFPDQIHVATVKNIIEPLIWIHIDSSNVGTPNHATTADSFNIFPVGWCASNGFPLQTPAFTKRRVKSAAEQSSTDDKQNVKKDSGLTCHKDGSMRKAWCPKIYFNHCCFTGPYLSKSRLAELPQTIGPGPVDLVMKEVLTRLINIAYKSSRVLKELQISGKSNPHMLQQTVKAKYKGKVYRATVEFVRNGEQVEEFCRQICKKLDCCPHLFGPNGVGQDCPDKCSSLTKTNFNYAFVKNKKKIGPPSNTGSGEDGLKRKPGPGRRRKRKHWRHMINNETAKSNTSESPEAKADDVSNTPESSQEKAKEPTPQSSDVNSDTEIPIKRKRRKLASHLPKSEIVTRGAKLPTFWKHHGTSNSFLARRGRPPGRRNFVVPIVKKKGRPVGSGKKRPIPTPSNIAPATAPAEPETRQVLNDNSNRIVPKEFQDLKIKDNPLGWSVDEVTSFIKETCCATMAPLLRDQEIDGQALLMLTMNSVIQFLNLKPGPATKLCTLIEQLKYQFYHQYA